MGLTTPSSLTGGHQAQGLSWYNEIDPFAAQTLRELIAEGAIAPGVVDERSIEDVRPDELSRYTQCHFFAGGGVWSYALRRAGWPDDAPIWTGSCPCQPFSTAGKGEGFADERHLWPAWQWLIEQCEPECIVGEQVADKGADAWLDLVQADVEGMGYAFGCVPLASAGFGAPNPRHRSFWMAYALGLRRAGFSGSGQEGTAERCHAGGVAHAGRWPDERRSGRGEAFCSAGANESEAQQRERGGFDVGDSWTANRLAHTDQDGCGEARQRVAPAGDERAVGNDDAVGLANPMRTGRPERWTIAGHRSIAGGGCASDSAPGPVNGYWRDADWLYCRDPGGPRWRPVDRGTFPLAPGTPARVGTLRISGNAINAEVATGFSEAVIDVLAHLLASERLAA